MQSILVWSVNVSIPYKLWGGFFCCFGFFVLCVWFFFVCFFRTFCGMVILWKRNTVNIFWKLVIFTFPVRFALNISCHLCKCPTLEILLSNTEVPSECHTCYVKWSAAQGNKNCVLLMHCKLNRRVFTFLLFLSNNRAYFFYLALGTTLVNLL